MTFYCLTDKGAQRPNNEDYTESFQYHWCTASGQKKGFTVLILSDGMGGAAAGEYASMNTVATIKQKFQDALLQQPPEELAKMDLKAFLDGSFREANKGIFDKSKADPSMEGMGCTIVTCLVHNETLTLGHVGDSRCYLFRENRLRQITRDHSYVQELVDQGKITADQALKHPNKNVITRAIGVNPSVEPDVITMPLFVGDILLLCSDGLSGPVEDSAILGVLRQEASQPFVDLKKISEIFIQMANLNGGPDNISVALYRHTSI